MEKLDKTLNINPTIASKLILFCCDIVSVSFAVWGSFLLTKSYYDLGGPSLSHFPAVVLLTLLVIGIVFFVFRNNSLYKALGFSASKRHFETLVKAWLVVVVTFTFLVFLLKLPLFHERRLAVVLFALLGSLSLALFRFVLIPRSIKLFVDTGWLKQNVIIVGAGEGGKTLAHFLYEFKRTHSKLIGFVDDDAGKLDQSRNGFPVFGTVDVLPEVITRYDVQEVFIGIPSLEPSKLTRILEVLKPLNVHVSMVADSFEIVYEKAPEMVEYKDGILSFNDSRLVWVDRIVKRIIDLVGCTLGLLLISPALALIALLIKLDSRGPVFFRQERVGKGGRTFSVYKFRTMKSNTESHHKKMIDEFMKKGSSDSNVASDGSPFFKYADLDEMTRMGKLLRRTSLDELPQLLNVLRGEMSLVGPRPEPTYQAAYYKPWHYARVAVKPGMTGFWQVFGRSTVNHDDMALMDIYYIQNWSLGLDLKILLKTPYIMISGKGAI